MTNNDENIPSSIKSYKIEKKTYKLTNMNLYTGTNTEIKEKVLIQVFPKETIKSDPNEVSLINNHTFLMKILNHKNILKLYEIIETKTHLFLIYEYFKGMKLSDYISLKKGLKEDESISIFKEILSTLVYIHDMYLCNLNINADNIIIDSLNKIKICDFKYGHFYTSQERYRTSFIGECYSTCPELHSKKQYNPETADIWSCGIVLYHMLTGHLPFEGKKDLEIIRSIIRGDYTIPKEIKPDMANLIKGLLEKDGEKRLKINDLFIQPVLEDNNISRSSLSQGLNVLTTKIPVDPIVLNLCSNIFKINEKKIKKDLENNNFTPITSLFNQIVTKLKNKNIKTINDLCSQKFISYLNNQENYLTQEEQINNIKNYLLKEQEIKKNSEEIQATILNNFYQISKGLDDIRRQYKQEKKGFSIIKRQSSFDIVKNSKRAYNLDDDITDKNSDEQEKVIFFKKLKRNSEVLEGLKGIDINKIARMANKNKKKAALRFSYVRKDNNAIEELVEEKVESDRSRSNSKDSDKNENKNENDVNELRKTITKLVAKNSDLEKDLNNAKYELFKKDSEIEEKNVKAEKNKNQRYELQLIKVKNDNALKEKINEVNDLKKKLEEKDAEILKKFSSGIDTELKSKLDEKDNEIKELKKKLEEKDSEISKKLEEKDNEINKIKKSLEEKESQISKTNVSDNKAKIEEKNNEINELKKKLEEKEAEIKLQLEGKENEINELKTKLGEKEGESSKKEESQSEPNKKDNEIEKLKKNLEEKNNEINELMKKLEEKDNIIFELNKKGEKDNDNEKGNYEKKIEELTNQLNEANSELNNWKSKNNNLDGKNENETSQLKNEIEEIKKQNEKLKIEIKNYENKLDNSKDGSDDMGIEELKKEKKNLEEELSRIKNDLGKAKCQLADSFYEKAMFETKYKRYIEKLEAKLISLGFKVKFSHK